MKKFLFLSIALFSLSAFSWAKPGRRIFQNTYLRLCNPIKYAYCSTRNEYGHRLGLIAIYDPKTARSTFYPLKVFAENYEEKTVLLEKVKSFIVKQNLLNSDRDTFDSELFLAKGHLEENTISGETVFQLTQMTLFQKRQH